jgi:uncharacterized repeat protein (TIGR03803 family)
MKPCGAGVQACGGSPGPPLPRTKCHNTSRIRDFTGAGGDGSFPLAGVAIGNDGILYGTTNQGGTRNAGTVFALKPPGALGDTWTETPIYLFAGGLLGQQPQSGVTIAGGSLYGASGEGGSATIYQLSPRPLLERHGPKLCSIASSTATTATARRAILWLVRTGSSMVSPTVAPAPVPAVDLAAVCLKRSSTILWMS